jgi:opacity protein-like surface antigen
MKRILTSAFALTLFIGTAGAGFDYRAQVTGARPRGDSYSYAADRRFYIAGFYTGTLTNSITDANGTIDGTVNSSFDVAAGVRATDNFRLEVNYHSLAAKYDAFKLEGNTVFMNAIFDGRIDSKYSLLRRQMMVPYVGLGAGISQNKIKGAGTELGREFSPVFAALAGVGFEFNKTFSIDLGYRYIYMLSPEIMFADVDADISPTAHQFRAGVRLNF